MDDLQTKSNNKLLIVVAIVIVALILYFVFKQNFTPFTYGAHQRYASQFSSTNQEADNIVSRAFAAESFANPNRFANDKLKIARDSAESNFVEQKLQQGLLSLNM